MNTKGQIGGMVVTLGAVAVFEGFIIQRYFPMPYSIVVQYSRVFSTAGRPHSFIAVWSTTSKVLVLF